MAQLLGFIALRINMQESSANVVEDQQAVVREVRFDAALGCNVQGCQICRCHHKIPLNEALTLTSCVQR